MSQKGADVSVFDAYQGHIPGYATALNPQPSAFHSVSAHARFDFSKHWLKNENRGFAVFLNADDLLNKSVWLPDLGSGTMNTIPVTRGRTLLFGIEVWQKKT